MLIRLYTSLFIFSFILLIWQNFGMEQILTLDKNSNIDAISDNNVIQTSLSSVAKISNSNNSKNLTCQIKSTDNYPFCELSFNLVSPFETPLDLTNYTKIAVKLAYIPPIEQQDLNIRLQIRNYEPGLSTLNDIDSFKLNEAKLKIEQINTKEEFILYFDNFYIPEWWISARVSNYIDRQVNVERAVYLKVMSPEVLALGQHKIEVEHIILTGKIISLTSLIQLLAVLWLLVIIYHVFIVIQHNRTKAHKLQKKQHELEKMNAALALETNELKDLVTRDTLTGIRNRHGMRDLLLDLVSKTQNNDFKLSAMYLDLDKFKLINDNYGHDIGDQVLMAFSKLISENIRSNDLFARWGGEEFILICPQLDCLQAHLLAEKLRLLITEKIWPEDIKVTCSIGVTEYRPKEDITELLKRADNALYQSKARGRNRTTML